MTTIRREDPRQSTSMKDPHTQELTILEASLMKPAYRKTVRWMSSVLRDPAMKAQQKRENDYEGNIKSGQEKDCEQRR